MTEAMRFALRLPRSLKRAAEDAAERDGTTLNQFITIAVAERVKSLEAWAAFQARAAQGDPARAIDLLDKAGSDAPRDGDRLPE